MPNPRPGEEREDFLDRCIPEVVGEGYEPDQAVAICIAYFEGEKDKAFDILQDNRIEYWKAFDRRRQSFETKFTRVIYRAVKEMLAGLEDATNANELQKPLKTKPLEDAYVDLYTEVGDRFARNTYAGLKRMEYTETKQEPSWIQQMILFVQIQANPRIVRVTDTVQKAINKIVMDGLENGLSIEEIKELILGVPGLPPLNGTLPYRARRIARTEIISASNFGSLQGAISTNLEFKKQWLSTPDARTRDLPDDSFDHRAANGQTVGKYEMFRIERKEGEPEELEFPGDPRGSAGNVIQCRCTQIYVTE
ncbi:MAG: phage minor head protein [Candidatus Nanopelagicaceae bacterium]